MSKEMSHQEVESSRAYQLRQTHEQKMRPRDLLEKADRAPIVTDVVDVVYHFTTKLQASCVTVYNCNTTMVDTVNDVKSSPLQNTRIRGTII
jgi:hypothetical protein